MTEGDARQKPDRRRAGRARMRARSVDLTPEKAMALVPQWQDATTVVTEEMLGGRTNSSFRVQVDGETFVLRLNAANGAALGLDYEREYEILRHVGRAGVGPEPVYVSQDAGVLVMRYIDGEPMSVESVRKPDNIRRIVRTLKKVHALPPPRYRLDLEEVVHRYCETVQESGLPFAQHLVALRPRIFARVREWANGTEETCLCHNDLFHSNMIDGAGISFIDWEYASVGDPMFELAALTQYHQFTGHHSEYLLEQYFNDASNVLRRRLRHTQAVFDLICILWVLAFRASAGGNVLPEAGSEDYLLEYVERLADGGHALRGWD